ncbi:hypothetical protein Nepgr_005314 [Nepenthes gracilis]|uniref:Uncharacterized protein n=1 Tax=Nepenthes gracilis TaxID=150966 RepID=A0AAD3S2Z1_NEPGR|nr:hypothetical protein Nepgr_005314 [Nepenthes gracilis]
MHDYKQTGFLCWSTDAFLLRSSDVAGLLAFITIPASLLKSVATGNHCFTGSSLECLRSHYESLELAADADWRLKALEHGGGSGSCWNGLQPFHCWLIHCWRLLLTLPLCCFWSRTLGGRAVLRILGVDCNLLRVTVGCFLFARLWGFDDAGHFLLQVVESVSAWQVEEGWSCIEVLFFVPSQCPHFEVLVPEWLLVSFGVFVPLVDGWVGLRVLSYQVGLNRSSSGLIAHFGSVDIADDELSLFVAFAGIVALGGVCSFGWQECEDVADFDGFGNGRDAAALFHDAGNFGLLYCAAVGGGL